LTDGNNDNELINDDTDHMTQSATGLTDKVDTTTINPITKKRVHHIKKAYVKPSPLKIIQRPLVQEAFSLLGYLTVGKNIIDKRDTDKLVSACKVIEKEKTSKRGRERYGNHMSYSIYFICIPFAFFLKLPHHYNLSLLQ
jgi:hypothetical protein